MDQRTVKIVIVTPAPPRSRHGNRHTAARWAVLLRSLGHRVTVRENWEGGHADIMIALHARRSHDAARRFKLAHPAAPLVVVLTGTDLYRDIRTDAAARASLRMADRLVVLQESGLAALQPAVRHKTDIIYQSAPRTRPHHPPARGFDVVVSGHLREEKDPFRIVAALQHLPSASRIRVIHLGAAMAPEMADTARQWMSRERRYRWLGEVTHARAQRLLAASHAMVISSRMEGGANVVSEALATGTPVIASRISGNIGMLGRDYAGYFPLQNEKALAEVLWRAESDRAFYALLKRQCAARRKLVTPEREARSLHRLIERCRPPTTLSARRSARRY